MNTRLYATEEQARKAIKVRVGVTRKDWKVQISDPVKRSKGWLDPCWQGDVPKDKEVWIIYVDSSGPYFPVPGFPGEGNVSISKGFAWVED